MTHSSVPIRPNGNNAVTVHQALELELVDEKGRPIGGESYVVQLPDGSKIEGHLDRFGQARIRTPMQGNCKITFPDLDRSAWSAKATPIERPHLTELQLENRTTKKSVTVQRPEPEDPDAMDVAELPAIGARPAPNPYELHFVPEEQELEIAWKIEQPAVVTAMQIDLVMTRGSWDRPLWTKLISWPLGSCPAEASTSFTGSLADDDANKSVKPSGDVEITQHIPDRFEKDLLDGSASPYRLDVRLMAPAGDSVFSAWLQVPDLVEQINRECAKGRQDRDLGVVQRLVERNWTIINSRWEGEGKIKGGPISAFHQVAVAGWEEAVDLFLENHGDPTEPDFRGWSSVDILTAKAEDAIELKVLPAVGDPELVPNGQRLTAPQILQRATKAETPELKARFDGFYEELYRFPLFRPILDVIALDACGKRSDRAFRGYVGRDATTIVIGSGMGVGSCHPRSAVLTIAGKRELEGNDQEAGRAGVTEDELLMGTLIHELTHAACGIVYDNWTVPYRHGDAARQREYQEAIVGALRRMHLLLGPGKSLTGENGYLKRLFFDRKGTYKTTLGEGAGRWGRPSPSLTYAEFIVDPPQGIATIGLQICDYYFKPLVDFFRNRVYQDCRAFAEAHPHVARLAPVPQPGGSMGKDRPIEYIAVSRLREDNLLAQRVLTEVRSRVAEPPVFADELATTALPAEWTIPADQQRTFGKIESDLPARILAKWGQSQTIGRLPDNIRIEQAHSLIKQLADCCVQPDGALVNPAKNVVRNTMSNWAQRAQA